MNGDYVVLKFSTSPPQIDEQSCNICSSFIKRPKSFIIKIMSYTTPIHPGMILQDELDELGISQSQLAAHIKVLPKTINEICNGKRGISAAMALSLSRALGASPQFWMNLQTNWELSRINQKEFAGIEKIAA